MFKGYFILTQFLEIAKDMKLDQLSSTKNLEQGIFTLRDMREQFQMISKMGPISKVMQMMPGIPPEMAKMVDENGGGDKLKKMVVIIDSMNQKELDSDPKLFTNEPSRIYRVARGSGATVVEIQQLLQQYKMFKDMMKNMPKGMLSGKQQRGQPNPNQIAKMQQGIQKMLPPGMLEQMGGMSGLMDMARKMSGGEGGGGIPDMQKMMEMMSRK